jgi:acetyl-CoA acetyltransferase
MAAAGRRRPVRPVAVVSFSQTHSVRREEVRNDVEMLQPVIVDVFDKVGLTKDDMGFVCSGSCDYLVGAPFSFVGALDAVGAWPPMRESHVEMDGAFALYEAWTQLQEDDIDTALVFSFGRSSMSELGRVLALQLDPYYMAPLWPDPVALAALQAQAVIDAGTYTEADFAAVAARSRRDARNNPFAQVTGDASPDELLGDDYVVTPLRRHALPPITDGATAVILAAGDRAHSLCDRPAWITGMDHRMETHALGARDLTSSPSTRLAAEGAGVLEVGEGTGANVDVAELHAPFAHQELILRDALRLGDGVRINPSGGALAAHALMVAGLVRIGEAASRIMDGTAATAVAHATSGPCLQQNLVCALAAEPAADGRR